MNTMDTEEKLIGQLRELLPRYSAEKLLVAVSGGIDSMVCAHILHKYRYPVSIVHCNFQLRGEESDEDAAFVNKWAAKNNIPCLEKKFRLKKTRGESTQMLARDARYEWFGQLAKEKDFGYIVTAHHLDDMIETSLMNIIRGTGINGLKGMPAMNGNIIRPMVFISRKEIEAYAKKEKIKWREDSSNKTEAYKRNKIRHQLIPLLQSLNPKFTDTYRQNLANWAAAARLYNQAVNRLKTDMVHFDEALGGFKISMLELMARGITPEILFELITEFGFNTDQARQIYEALETQPGKKFYSPDHILLIDRMFIMIKPLDELSETEEMTIPHAGSDENEHWQWAFIDADKLATMHTGKNELLLDAGKLVWPVHIRKWKAGDKFTPMGMKGQKKISDFLTDKKLDQFAKNNTWIVTNAAGAIAGIVGLRPDENFKISKKTKQCIYIKRKSGYL